MGRKRLTPEQIIQKLRTAEVEIGGGKSVKVVVKKLGITEQTYYRWRKEYGGLRLNQAKRLKCSPSAALGHRRCLSLGRGVEWPRGLANAVDLALFRLGFPVAFLS